MAVSSVFTYAGHTHPEGEVVLTKYEVLPLYTQRGHRKEAIYRMTIQGELIETGQALLDKIAVLIDAYSVDGGDAILYAPNGVATRHQLIQNVTANLSGVHVVHRSWPKADAAELATVRTFYVVLEATYAEQTSEILWFQESIRHIGTTGPRWVAIPQYSGPPIIQLIHQVTPQKILQSGMIVGFQGYPLGNVPGPILPALEHTDERVVEMMSPQYRGRKFTDYGIRWHYSMTSITPQSLIPNFQ